MVSQVLELCSTFHTGNEPAIFYNNHAHAPFHILRAYLRLFWCLIERFRYRFRIRYKTNTILGPVNS